MNMCPGLQSIPVLTMQKPKMPTTSSDEWLSGKTSFSDAAEYVCGISSLWDVNINQIQAASTPFRCRYVTDGRAMVYEEVYGVPASVRGALKGKHICFAISNDIGRSGCWKGRSLPRNALAYSHGGREADGLWAQFTTNIMAILPHEFLSERMRLLSGQELEQVFPPAGMYISLKPAAMVDLVEFFRSVLNGKPYPPGTKLLTLAADAVIEASIGCDDMGPDGSPAAWYHFRRVVDRIEHDSIPNRLHDLAAELGCTLRTLESAFRQCAGMTPGSYLRYERLNRVRAALVAHESSDTTVTALAIEHGFTELGRFSRDYNRVFGELPSQTLHRRFRRCFSVIPGIG
jgi:AraC-like DNA-binding protein